ncbi:MAG: hypothetical protein ACYC9L_03345 [Sulfuricaulis sp.]
MKLNGRVQKNDIDPLTLAVGRNLDFSKLNSHSANRRDFGNKRLTD